MVTIMEKHTEKPNPTNTRTFGPRPGHTTEIVNQIKSYLREHPVEYHGQVENLLEMIYCSYTEFNSVETPEFKAIVNPLDEKLRRSWIRMVKPRRKWTQKRIST